MSDSSEPYALNGGVMDNWLTMGTKPQMNPVLGGIVGDNNPFFAPAPAAQGAPTGPVATPDPFAGLISPQPQQQQSNPEFDTLVNSILDQAPPVQGADAPISEAPKADAGPKMPKSSPLFGDLNIHMAPQPHTQVQSQDERDAATTKKESIF